TTKAFVESIRASGDHTVVFKMKDDFAAFLPLAGSTLIMPEHVWSDIARVDLYQNDEPVVSGPFLLRQYRPRAFLHLVKNEHYWRGAPKIEEVVIKVFMNLEAEVVALKSGELDVLPDLSGSEALIPPLEEDENVAVLIDRWPHILYVAPNHRIYPFGVKEFRKAIDIALDKKAILETALAGYGEMPLMGYVPPLVTKWSNTSLEWRGARMTETERISEANAILENLGFKRGEDGVRGTGDGKPLEFTIRCMTYPSYIRTAEMVKENLEAIGIKLTVQVSDPQTLYGGLVFSGKHREDWDLLVHGSTMSPDPDHFAREFAPDSPNPWDNAVALGWKNEEIQSLLRESRREMDQGKRWEMIQKVQELFADELVVITLGHRLHPAAHRTDRYHGWKPEMVNYGGMIHPLGSIVNVLSLEPK
ncbi:MAG: ABC transporter substrate-binding protein, partial [Acidobacteriota bacterium]